MPVRLVVADPDPDDRALEAKVRRMAKRSEMQLVKSRCRNPESPSYGGYGVIDPWRNWALAGFDHFNYSLTLAEAAEFIGAAEE
jgi:hypothetical protein